MRHMHIVDPKLQRLPILEGQRINRWIWGQTVLIVVGAVLLALLFPPPMFMTMLSAVLVVLGFSIAANSYFRREPQAVAAATHWDQAGMLLFIGFAVAMLSEPADFIAYMEHGKTARPEGTQ